jgi:hypothetical protein
LRSSPAQTGWQTRALLDFTQFTDWLLGGFAVWGVSRAATWAGRPTASAETAAPQIKTRPVDMDDLKI